MECIQCGDDTRVIDCVKVDGVVYRKRGCKYCGSVFYTKEDMCKPFDAQVALTEKRTAQKRYYREAKK